MLIYHFIPLGPLVEHEFLSLSFSYSYVFFSKISAWFFSKGAYISGEELNTAAKTTRINDTTTSTS